MKILVINGANLNMLGIREPNLYGKSTYKDLCAHIKSHAKNVGVKVKLVQSNCEGEMVTIIQRALGKYEGIVINPGAYTHTSVAILDALKAVNIPTAEVHITDIDAREEYRKTSYVAEYACIRKIGLGFDGYCQAIDELVKLGGKK